MEVINELYNHFEVWVFLVDDGDLAPPEVIHQSHVARILPDIRLYGAKEVGVQ